MDTRARVQRLRAGLVRRLPDRVERPLRRLRDAAVESNRLANLEATVAGATATNEASVVGLSQELARLGRKVDDLTERVDELAAAVREVSAPPEPPPNAGR